MSGLGKGSYDIEVRGIKAEESEKPVSVSQEGKTKINVTASSSHEEGGWGAAGLVAAESDMAIDHYTVIGYPKVRHIKISATRLGAPAADEAGVYRLQLKRVKIVRP